MGLYSPIPAGYDNKMAAPDNRVRVVAGSLRVALDEASSFEAPICWEVAPVNRRSGGNRRWYGLLRGAWAPQAEGGIRPAVDLSKEQLDALPPLPAAQEGYWILRFLNANNQVLDPEIRIDPRHSDEEPRPTAPPPAATPPPPAAPPLAPSEAHAFYLAWQESERQKQAAFALLLNGVEAAQRSAAAAVDVGLKGAVASTQSLSALASENETLRKKNLELQEQNTGLAAMNAQLENENAPAKMIGDIYSQPGGAEQFSNTILALSQGIMDLLQGKRQPAQD